MTNQVENRKSIVVCVTRQSSCERLIVEGASYARQFDYSLTVIHVVRTTDNFFEGATDGEALDTLFNLAKQHFGQIQLIKSDDVFSSIVKCACDLNAAILLVGQSHDKSASNLFWRLRQALPEVEVIESAARI